MGRERWGEGGEGGREDNLSAVGMKVQMKSHEPYSELNDLFEGQNLLMWSEVTVKVGEGSINKHTLNSIKSLFHIPHS